MDTKHDDRLVSLMAGAVSRRAAVRGLGGAGLATALAIAAGAAAVDAGDVPIGVGVLADAHR